jgi:hypothetical protein
MKKTIDLIKQVFDESYLPWNVVFPKEKIDKRESGVIETHGWLIQYCFGVEADKEYLDVYASHIMTNDRHYRIYDDGEIKGLPAIDEAYSYGKDDTDEMKKTRKEKFYKHNRDVAHELIKKGFTHFSMNMAFHVGVIELSSINGNIVAFNDGDDDYSIVKGVIMSYREEQKEKIIAKRDGMFHDAGGGIIGKPQKFALKNSWLNLWSGIADDAVVYFLANSIPWWKANGEISDNDLPSSHLLSSQVACVNHLYFLRQRQDLAEAILKNIDERIFSAEKITSPDAEAGYVAFEIIGSENYLGERSHTRAALSTSVDAVMIGKKNDGKNILVLIEWKYTECYTSTNLHKPAHDIIYKPLLVDKDCPIHIDNIYENNFEALYYEPFYQLMRQTLLGWKMVDNNEYDCDEFVHIHVIPDENLELLNNITSPLLRKYGNTLCEVWKGVLKKPDHYKIISPEHFLEPLKNFPDTSSLLKYLEKRYWK